MLDRQLAESWGEKYLSIVSFIRSLSFIPSDLPFIHASPRVGDFPDDISGLDPDSETLPEFNRPYVIHVAKEQWRVQYDLSDIYVTIMRDIPVGEDGLHAAPDGIRTEGRNFAETFLGISQDSQ